MELSCAENLKFSFDNNVVERTNKQPNQTVNPNVTTIDVDIPLAVNECVITEEIHLEENDTLTISNPSNEVVTSLQLSGRASLKRIPDTIFETFPYLNELHLVFSGIETLAAEDFVNATNLNSLHIEQNNVTILGASIFTRANNLKTIRLPSNNIVEIDELTFDGLTDLQYLHLQQNNLTQVKNGTFTRASSLREIYLNDNQIDTLADGVFDLVNLTKIFLQRNKLKVLSNGLFGTGGSLQTADFSSNHLTTIGEVFEQCKNLHSLALNDNQILSVNWLDVAKMKSLLILSLENNGLKFPTVVDDSYEDDDDKVSVSRLQYLNLGQNQLYHSDVLKHLAIFRRLQVLDLSDNQYIIVDDVKNIKRIFPSFFQLNVANNILNCKWVEDTLPFVRKQKIILNTGKVIDPTSQKLIEDVACSPNKNE